MNFPDADYARQRMLWCVFLIDGKAAQIIDIHSKERGLANFFLKSEVADVRFDNKSAKYPTIDYTPVPLGNVNIPGMGASFIARQPARTWRVGLHHDNYINLSNGANPFNTMASLGNCIEGNYPSIEKAIKFSQENLTSLAFHRYLSVFKNRLMFKTREVGKITGKDDWSLTANYSFLQEYIEELMNEVH